MVVSMKKKAVFLDRDGVINRAIVKNGKCYAPRHLKDFQLYSYTKNSIEKLKKMKFLIFVVTNQPDIGNKFVSQRIVNQMHLLLKKKLQLMKLKFAHILKVMDVYVVNQNLK